MWNGRGLLGAPDPAAQRGLALFEDRVALAGYSGRPELVYRRVFVSAPGGCRNLAGIWMVGGLSGVGRTAPPKPEY